MEEQSKLYRKKSLERISAPEKLDDYIRVTNPGAWIIVIAVLILLIAAGIWAFTFELDANGLRPIDFLMQ